MHDVFGPRDIGLEHRPPGLGWDTHLVNRGAVDQGVATGHGCTQGITVRQVAGDELAADLCERGSLIGGPHERLHVVASLPKGFPDGPSDEAGSAC